MSPHPCRTAGRQTPGTALALFLALAAAGSAASGCHKAQPSQFFIDTAAVVRQPITITVSATGTIEPAEVVQVKSKASGQIIKMPVEMGTFVKPGDLIAQIDPRDPQSRYDQSVAAVHAAEANLSVTRAARTRADELYAQRAMTAPEHEQAVLGYANAQSQLATARTNLQVAQIQLADVTIRAPQAGTIIDKPVTAGQVIASATSNVSGGTTLVTLANLGNIVDSTLVNESDIGKVKPGQTASVTVDAYPDKVFHGVVDKVSPQATVQQSVTMFPVIIRLDNSAGLLKPGMNSDVSILVSNRPNALVIPNEAIGTMQDVAAASAALGIDPATAQQAFGSRGGRNGNRGAGGVSRGQGTGDGGRGDASSAPAGDSASRAARRANRARTLDSAGGEAVPHALPGVSDTTITSGGTASTGPHPAVVLVLENGKFVPRRVVLGTGNYDVTEVVSGLRQGDRVALVQEARIQVSRDSNLARIQSRSGLPGMGGGGAAGGAAGGAGGNRGGAGGAGGRAGGAGGAPAGGGAGGGGGGNRGAGGGP